MGKVEGSWAPVTYRDQDHDICIITRAATTLGIELQTGGWPLR